MAKGMPVALLTIALVAAGSLFYGLVQTSGSASADRGTPSAPPGVAGAANTPTPTPTSQRPWNLTADLIDDYPSFPSQGAKKTWVFRIANYGSQYGCETSPQGTVHVGLTGHADSKFNYDVGPVACNQYFDINVSSVATAAPGSKITATSSAFHIPYPNIYSASDHVCFVSDPGVCANDADADGCPSAAEQQSAAGSEMFGGERDYLNPNDYFNPSHDGENRIDDVLAVVDAYFIDAGNPAYNADTDRTLVGPNAWNLGPPDGKQRIDDVVNIVHQYYHDCS